MLLIYKDNHDELPWCLWHCANTLQHRDSEYSGCRSFSDIISQGENPLSKGIPPWICCKVPIGTMSVFETLVLGPGIQSFSRDSWQDTSLISFQDLQTRYRKIECIPLCLSYLGLMLPRHLQVHVCYFLFWDGLVTYCWTMLTLDSYLASL